MESRILQKIEEYKVPTTIDQKGLPIIAIPTTAGTGSECTCFTIITNEVNDEKMLCQGIGFMPAAAIVDYQLTLSLPQRITADTGIDALTHAIEAYVSQKANLYKRKAKLHPQRYLRNPSPLALLSLKAQHLLEIVKNTKGQFCLR